MAAYLVKILPLAVGAGFIGSGTLGFAYISSKNKFEKQTLSFQKEKELLLRDTQILRRTNDYLIQEVDNYKKREKELTEQLEQNTWTTKLVGAGVMGATALGGVVGYSMR